MNVYPYTQLATRVALSLSIMQQERFLPLSFQLAQTMPVCLLAVKCLLSLGLLLGYKTRIMAGIAAFLFLLAIFSLLYIADNTDSQLGLPVIFFTGAVVLFRDMHYYWSIDSILEQGTTGK
jgi:uncharacterized membrane protein YphA (DoxX/SURF4 family)